jgi:hypothetical protein
MPCVTFSVVHHRDWALVRASTCRRRPKSLDGVHGGQWRCVLTLRTCRVEENNATDDGDLLGPIERGVHRVAVHVQIVGYLRNGIRRNICGKLRGLAPDMSGMVASVLVVDWRPRLIARLGFEYIKHVCL